jgi:TRAP-type C4-dicarboxylate transport system permease small subunit
MCFLFAGAAFQRGEMVAVDMFTRSLGRRTRALVLVPAYLATIAFLAMLVYYGWRYAFQNLIQTMPGVDVLWESLTGLDTGVSIFWMYVSVPIGGALLAVHILLTTIRIGAEAIGPGPLIGDA